MYLLEPYVLVIQIFWLYLAPLQNFGDRRFSVSGSRLWNDLPTNIKNAESLTQFKTLLKTYFFTQVFGKA